jgi:hypothetical protein
MKDYSQAYVYRYWNNKTQYFGSSANTWDNRQRQHLASSNMANSRYIVNGDLPWQCEIIEHFPCENKYQLQERERFYIENFECNNSYVPNRTDKEWREANKEVIARKKQIYHIENRKKILKRCDEWYYSHREEVAIKSKVYREKNAEVIKKRKHAKYEKDKTEVLAKCKQYRESNKGEISARMSTQVKCNLCDAEVSKRNIARHKKENKKCRAHVANEVQAVMDDMLNVLCK